MVSELVLDRHPEKSVAPFVRSVGTTNRVNDGLKPACSQFQSRQCDGQLETPWAGASGIQVEDLVNSFDPRLVRVA
jgi:hypothetical protein